MTQPTTFHTPREVDLDLRNPAGTVEVVAAETATSTVDIRPVHDTEAARQYAERVRVELSGNSRRLRVTVAERWTALGRTVPLAISVTVPVGSRLHLKTATADMLCRGRLGALQAHTATGAVDVEEVTGRVEVHAATGRIQLGSTGPVQVHVASGSVRIRHATGDAQLHVESATVRIGTAEASVRVHTSSGDIEIGESVCGAVDVMSASGDLRVGLRAGVLARLDLASGAGRARSELPVEDTAGHGRPELVIRARAGSGNVLVTRAAAVG